ncbi:O-antigen ligase family protein [Photobacterium sp. 1_MG-2023]|uniref:O-antigen ligase family protein n=1 Tax=Photobacterium sp. 1_MG-2023 TaxID=3062646 RepID=UPI0026E25FFF|nr:O-antigen ligase family protein [Photobacterium sp. 1_MG-2023]MDO6707167.1 O-antigen ligase family protein [Photobacterium sp. 1_MG-2023]
MSFKLSARNGFEYNILKFKVDSIALLLITIFPIIDTFVGFLNQHSDSMESIVGVLFKSLVLLLLILRVFVLSKYRIFAHLVLCLSLIIILYQISYYDAKIVSELSSLTKILFFVYSILYFETIAKNDEYTINIKLLLWVYFLSISFNVSVGVLGYGGHTYESLEYGVKGFVYAGNELSFLLCLISSCLIYIYRKNIKLVLVIGLVSVTLGYFIATKSALFGCVFLLAFYFFLYTNYLAKVFVFALCIGAFFIFPFSNVETQLLSRLLDRFSSVELVSFIFSGRDQYLDIILQYVQDYSSVFSFLLGYSKTVISQSGYSGVEMDFVDIYFWYGAVFLIFISCFILSVYLKIWLSSLKQLDKVYLTLSYSLMIFLSAIAGHVITSGMISPVFGLYIYLSNRDNF